MQVQQLGDSLVRHVPTHGANLLGEPLRIARILRQPSSLSTVTPSTACAGHPTVLICHIDTPAGGIGVPHAARPTVVEGSVPSPAARAHGGCFRRTKLISRAWGSPKIACSRLRARSSAGRTTRRVSGPASWFLPDNCRQCATDLGQDSRLCYPGPSTDWLRSWRASHALIYPLQSAKNRFCYS